MDNYQMNDEKSSGSSVKWIVAAVVLLGVAGASAAIGLPMYEKSQHRQLCKNSVTEINHKAITSNISVDFIKDEASDSLFSDVYKYDFYNGSKKIFTLVQDNQYGFTKVDSEIKLDPQSLDLPLHQVVEYLKTLKINSSYEIWADVLHTDFVLPAFSYKDDEVSVSWSEGTFSNSMRQASKGVSDLTNQDNHSKWDSFNLETSNFKVAMSGFSSERLSAALNEFSVYFVEDEEESSENADVASPSYSTTPADEAGSDAAVQANTEVAQAEAAQTEQSETEAPVVEEKKAKESDRFVIKNLKVNSAEPEFTGNKVLKNLSGDITVDQIVYDIAGDALVFDNLKFSAALSGIDYGYVEKTCKSKDLGTCISDLDMQTANEFYGKFIGSAVYKINLSTLLNNGKIDLDANIDFGGAKSTQELMTSTKVDMHLEFNKNTMSQLVENYPAFATVQQFINMYDKNNFADKYVTNFMCTNGIVSCTINGTPLK